MGRTMRRVLEYLRVRRWWLAALVAVAVLAALRVSPHAELRLRFPHTRPKELVQLLADYNHLRDLHDHRGSWWLEDERSNASSWSYVAGYECGARCAGRASVRLRWTHAPVSHRHPHPPGERAPPSQHTLQLELTECGSLLLMPWPKFCETLWVEAVVIEAGGGVGGAEYTERTVARRSLLATLAGPSLQSQRELVLQRLQNKVD